jgi:pimeloyl-ACP methyl ester carboxylesterase
LDLSNIIENSCILEKEIFQENASFIHNQWEETNLDGWSTHILDIGKGKPIFFVPIMQNLEVFDSLLIQHFSKQFRIITFQRRESEYEILDKDSRSADIKSVLDYLNIKQAHFVAHSSGSIATTNLALEQPSIFLSYVWMNLSLQAAMDMSLWRKKLANTAKYVPLPEITLAKILAKSTCGKKGSLFYERVIEQFMAIKRTANISKFKRWFSKSVWSLGDYNWTHELHNMTMPVLLLNSDNDMVNSVEAMGKIKDFLPNCYGYKIIKGGRHFFQYPCYDQVINYMEDFYEKLL